MLLEIVWIDGHSFVRPMVSNSTDNSILFQQLWSNNENKMFKLSSVYEHFTGFFYLMSFHLVSQTYPGTNQDNNLLSKELTSLNL